MAMDDTITDCAAVGEVVVFLNYVNDLPDPRQQGKVAVKSNEIIAIPKLLDMLAIEAAIVIAQPLGG
jgi:hypothetical protein